jgi:hypothetical protein
VKQLQEVGYYIRDFDHVFAIPGPPPQRRLQYRGGRDFPTLRASRTNCAAERCRWNQILLVLWLRRSRRLIIMSGAQCIHALQNRQRAESIDPTVILSDEMV